MPDQTSQIAPKPLTKAASLCLGHECGSIIIENPVGRSPVRVCQQVNRAICDIKVCPNGKWLREKPIFGDRSSGKMIDLVPTAKSGGLSL